MRSASDREPGRPLVPNSAPPSAPTSDRSSSDRPISDRPGPELIDRRFGREEITLLRHEVSARLVGAGLVGDRLQGFVLAVNEVITNVVLHAGGHGRIVVRLVGSSAWCTVTDSGPGIPERYVSRQPAPEAFEVGGRGIWLAYQLCDEVTIATGPIGTTIGLRIGLPRREAPS